MAVGILQKGIPGFLSKEHHGNKIAAASIRKYQYLRKRPGSRDKNYFPANSRASQQSGWLVYNTHGLDDEGWGPIGSDYLDKLLERLLNIKTVEIIPAGKALSGFK